jgi:hypothetical protein
MNIILTAGRNERGGGVCKALMPVGGKLAIEHQMEILGSAAIVCQSQHAALLRNYGRVVIDNTFSGPAGALYAALAEEPPDDPITVIFADTLFQSLPDGTAWCGVWHTEERRVFDTVVCGSVVRKQPNGYGDLVCVGAYRFPDPWQLVRQVAWLVGRLRYAEMPGLVNSCNLPFVKMPSWRDTGSLV